ncbi:MAG: type II toxin-antitoxin system PemK/MazF family toxin [Rhizobiales bacterium]|nr:type II toxin-antitoxin system PemK/MazF family toxin [Hyphomicrobiales bacterium]
MICDHWQVVAVPFPFMERPALKRRPALVISTKDFNAANGHTIMAMITAAMLDSWASDHPLLRPAVAGLKHACYVRWKVFTLPNSLIVKTIGDLADEDREALMIKARTIFIRV